MKARLRPGPALLALLVLSLVPAAAWAAPSEFEALRARGLLWSYLGVFAAGVLTSLTPCVYPMITITVGIFGARDAGSRLRAFGLAAMYVLGMIAMYAALGLVFALSGKASGAGSLLANPAVVVPVVALYVVLAASMFGAFAISLPAAVQARLSGVGGRGVAGAFLMGLVGGITAAPCTGPMLAGLLTFIAATHSAFYGLTLMMVYGLGMGLLFLVIATFTLSLPKSGMWMEVVKAVGGIALLVVGVYFLRPIWPGLTRLSSPSPAFLAAALGTLVAGGLCFANFLRRKGRGRPRLYKLSGIALTTLGAAAAMSWWLTPRSPLAWRGDRAVALAEAHAAERPVLLDFSADWCAPCKRFEADVFSDPAVHAELATRFVAVKFDVSRDDDADEEAKRAWSAAALPTVILVGPDGKERRRFQGEPPSADEFLGAIRAVR